MSDESIGTVLKISNQLMENIHEYQVIIGFSGFGNVGYLTLSHIIETTDLESISFWGNSSWYYKNNLESTLTAYRHEESKSIIITTRLPIFVSTMNNQFWTSLVNDILSWKCRRYIIIGGLREDTRLPNSTDWAAFAPTRKWTELFGHTRTLADKLSMIGPLSSLLTMGTSREQPVLGLLAYCNMEDDPEASLFALQQIEKLAGINIPNKNKLHTFDFTFLSAGRVQANDINDTDEPYDDFDIDDLI